MRRITFSFIGQMFTGLIILVCISCSQIKKLERCAKKGNIECIELLTEQYMTVNENHNDEKAMYWAKKGAELNSITSMNNLAYLIGPYSKEAWTLYQKAARLGDADAMTTLAIQYSGNSHPNQDSAFYWANKGLKEGDLSAYKILGDFYYNGIGTKQDYKMALFYYKKGCDKGIDNNWQCCDSIISLYKTKLSDSSDTLECYYWQQRKKDVVRSGGYK